MEFTWISGSRSDDFHIVRSNLKFINNTFLYNATKIHYSMYSYIAGSIPSDDFGEQ